MEDAGPAFPRKRLRRICHYSAQKCSRSRSLWLGKSFVTGHLKHQWTWLAGGTAPPHKLVEVPPWLLLNANSCQEPRIGPWWSWKCLQWSFSSQTFRYSSSDRSWCPTVHPKKLLKSYRLLWASNQGKPNRPFSVEQVWCSPEQQHEHRRSSPRLQAGTRPSTKLRAYVSEHRAGIQQQSGVPRGRPALPVCSVP